MTHTVPSYLIQPRHPVTINLVGLGGTGSQLLTKLAQIDWALRQGGLGLGPHPGLSVRCFDPDEVTDSNIGRQGFFPPDVGLNKAVCLVTRVNRAFGLQWQAIPTAYNRSVINQGFHKANLVISCVDTAKARIEIAQLQKTPKHDDDQLRQYYWLDLGNARDYGQVILGTLQSIKQPRKRIKNIPTADRLPTILDLYPHLERHDNVEEQGHSCSVAQSLASQDLCINSMIAEWGKKILWSLFKQMRIQHHGVYVNLETMTVNPIPISKFKSHGQRKRRSSRR